MEARFNQIVEFHGHRCPGIAYGLRIALAGMNKISATKESELKIESPTNSCPLDAIQVITGCTIGNGKLRIQPNDEFGFTFTNISSGKSVTITNHKIDYWSYIERIRNANEISLEDKIRIILKVDESDVIRLISMA